MKEFKEWFKNKVTIKGFPLPHEVKEYEYVINVSDEYISSCFIYGIKCFWFPMNECYGEMGLNSIYAAMQILYEAEKVNAKTLIHCHAGVNRSQTIGDCYWFMRNGGHRIRKKASKKVRESLNIMFDLPADHVTETDGMNQLQSNCHLKMLPEISTIEKYLSKMPEYFDMEISMKGGGLDICKSKMVNDNDLLDWYMKGFNDELGRDSAIIGDDVMSNDYRSNDVILKEIKQ